MTSRRARERANARPWEQDPEPDDHQAIREAAKSLADRLAKKRKPATPTKG